MQYFKKKLILVIMVILMEVFADYKYQINYLMLILIYGSDHYYHFE